MMIMHLVPCRPEQSHFLRNHGQYASDQKVCSGIQEAAPFFNCNQCCELVEALCLLTVGLRFESFQKTYRKSSIKSPGGFYNFGPSRGLNGEGAH